MLDPQITAGEMSWLRPFYVFDEAVPSPAVLRAALAAKAKGDAVHLSTPGARHDFVHARDVAEAIKTAMIAKLTGSIDIGSGMLTSVSALIESYGCEWVTAGEGSRGAASADPADVGALRNAGWSPSVTDTRLSRR